MTTSTATLRLPPEPTDWPLLQAVRSVFNPIGALEAARQRYGDIFIGKTPGYDPFVLVSDPVGIEEIFTTLPDRFEIAGSNRILQPLLGDRSTVLLDGEAHQQRRKLLMPPLHGEYLRSYGQTITEIVQGVIDRLPLDRPFSIRAMTQEITLRVVLRVVFGLDNTDRGEQLRQLFSRWVNLFDARWESLALMLPVLQQDWGAWSPWGRFLQLRSQIDELLYAELADRRANPCHAPRPDVLSLLMETRDEAGEPLSDLDLHDELMTLLFAGHETTASALAWAFYWLATEPDVHQKLQQELAAHPNLEPLDIARLPYLSAVCSETLRIYPPVMFAFARAPKAPMQIMGFDIAPGMMLAPVIYLVHHREDLYPEPHRFRPDRFLERQYSPYEYLPFGGSNRRCVGSALALLEMKLTLAAAVSRCDWQLVADRPIKPIRRGVILSPSGEVPMQQRRPPLS